MPGKVSKPREAVKHLVILFVLFFAFAPLYLMVVISFKTNDQYNANSFLPDAIGQWHPENWKTGWLVVYNYIANSIVTAISAVVLCLTMAILTSYVLARYRFAGKNIIYYGMIATMFLPGTTATLVTLLILIIKLGMINSLITLVLVWAVGGQVICMFILKQFIEDIPKELFESAQMDGAGHLQQIWNIVLPMSGSVLSTLAIMQFVGYWNDLILPMIVIGDTYKRTIPAGLMLLDGEYVKEWGPLMAGYAISSIPLIILFLFTMRLFVKGVSAGAVKG